MMTTMADNFNVACLCKLFGLICVCACVYRKTDDKNATSVATKVEIEFGFFAATCAYSLLLNALKRKEENRKTSDTLFIQSLICRMHIFHQMPGIITAYPKKEFWLFAYQILWLLFASIYLCHNLNILFFLCIQIENTIKIIHRCPADETVDRDVSYG